MTKRKQEGVVGGGWWGVLWDWSKQWFLGYVPKSTDNKTEINKWNFINLKIFHTEKEIIYTVKGHPTDWGNIFQIIYLTRS
jgi:hypothetical protein